MPARGIDLASEAEEDTMTERAICQNLLTLLALGLAALLGSCGDSDSGPVSITTIPPEILPRCRSLKLVYSFFGQNEARYRHLDISAPGTISRAGTVLWRLEAPEETAALDEVLTIYAAGMDRAVVMNFESPFPAGALVVHAHADVRYEVIEFLLGRCLSPSVGISRFQFPVRGSEGGEIGVLGLDGFLGFEPGEIHEWDTMVDMIDEDGVTSYSVDGAEPCSLGQMTQVIRAYLEEEDFAWIRPNGAARWGAVTELVGELLGPGVTRRESSQQLVTWLGGSKCTASFVDRGIDDATANVRCPGHRP